MTNPQDLSPLIEKIEAAEEGSPRLSQEFMGAVDPNGYRTFRPIQATQSIDAIVGLIEREFQGCIWRIPSENTALIITEDSRRGLGIAATPSLALCSAFLKAIQAKREVGG